MEYVKQRLFCSTRLEWVKQWTSKSWVFLVGCISGLLWFAYKNKRQSNEIIKKQEKEISELKNLLVEYQLATVYHDFRDDFRDDMPNNNFRLMESIDVLSKDISDLAWVKKPRVELNSEEMDKLIRLYTLKVKHDATQYRQTAHAVLQRFVIDTIMEMWEKRMESVQEKNLNSIQQEEADLALLKCLHVKYASQHGAPKDVVIARQLQYYFQSRYAFHRDHPVIRDIVDNLYDTLNTIRNVEDATKRESSKRDTEKVVLDFVSLIYVRRFTAPVIPELRFFEKNDLTDDDLMDIGVNAGAGKCMVDLCYFPLFIGDNRVVYRKADVLLEESSAAPCKSAVVNLGNVLSSANPFREQRATIE